jgi:hypothetical protein
VNGILNIEIGDSLSSSSAAFAFALNCRSIF